MLRALPQHGYAETTIGDLTKEAGVSRAAFYGQFESKEECFLATYDLAGQWLCERVERVASSVRRSGPSASAPASPRRCACSPPTLPLAHLIAVEALQAGAAARRRQQVCLERLAEILRAGRPSGCRAAGGARGAAARRPLSLVGRYVDTGRVEQLPDATARSDGCYTFLDSKSSGSRIKLAILFEVKPIRI